MDYDVNYDNVFKIIVIGDSAIGKSSLLDRYMQDTYTSTYSTTIGVDFKIKGIEVGDKIYKLQIWDTAGQERFRTITSSYYRGASIVILCFSYDSAASFANLPEWQDEIDRYCLDKTPVLIVGTKSDFRGTSHQEVDDNNIISYCINNNLEYCSTSAKLGENCNKIFEKATHMLLNKQQSVSNITAAKSININLMKTPRKNGCC